MKENGDNVNFLSDKREHSHSFMNFLLFFN